MNGNHNGDHHGNRPTGIVLGGGRSSRFGRDKLVEPLGGEPLLWRPIRALAPVCREIVLVLGPDGPLPPLPPDVASIVRVARDPEPFGGPLVGLAAGLAVATGRWVVVVAGDQPNLRPGLLGLLAELIATERASRTGAVADATRAVALVDEAGVTRPLPCALDREAAQVAAESLLTSGERRLRALLAALDVVAIPEAAWRSVDPDAGWTRDIDLPDDLLRVDPVD